jgi:ribonuclease R
MGITKKNLHKPAKTSHKPDPFAAREAQKYEHPIPSREFIMLQLDTVGKPMNFQSIAKSLNLKDAEDLEALRRRLQAMERDGQLIHNRRNKYGLAKKMDLVSGRVISHPKGYGFLVPDEGGGDLFLSEKEMRSLMHGDRVLANIIGVDYRGRREGALVEVLERNTHEVVGRFYYKPNQGIAFVEPDNRRIPHRVLVDRKTQHKAKEGDIVVVKLIQQPTQDSPPIGEVIEVMGNQRAPGMETNIAIRAHELPHEWPAEVLAELGAFAKDVPDSVVRGREDLRKIPFVTIDGEDAQDFDDAVYCEPRGKGWLLQVAIADVSAYVKPDTALDAEAKKRGNSVYFPNRVIPMLPEILSNQLCSLKPEVNRLCLVCELAIDFYGRTRRTRYFEAVIRSAARLTYTEVAEVLASKKPGFRYPQLLPHLNNLYRLYQLLLKRRKKRGAIDFETIETRIIFNDQRKIEKIVPVARNDAHKLIEEMMLAANVATAEWLTEQHLPLLYRVHGGPKAEKLSDLRGFLRLLGLQLGGKDQPEAKHYAKVIEKIQTRPDIRMIQTVLLRSLQLAVYSPELQGHFGLAYPCYTHFTSPIRRYPDLLVHRAIRHRLHGRPLDQFPYSTSDMQQFGEHCSMTDRRAEEATRDVISWLKCEYMQDKIGLEFDGIITAVTPFGLFIELDGIFVEGLVHVTALRDDYYHFDPIGQRLHGEYTGMVYRLSERVRVKVVGVKLEEKKIDLELVNVVERARRN